MMTENEVVEKLNSLTDEEDKERVHVDADNILCDFLRSQGFGDIADAFDAARSRVGFWYD